MLERIKFCTRRARFTNEPLCVAFLLRCLPAGITVLFERQGQFTSLFVLGGFTALSVLLVFGKSPALARENREEHRKYYFAFLA